MTPRSLQIRTDLMLRGLAGDVVDHGDHIAARITGNPTARWGTTWSSRCPGGALARTATDNRTHPRQQLVERERFGQVVVGAGVKAGDDVGRRGPRTKRKHGADAVHQQPRAKRSPAATTTFNASDQVQPATAVLRRYEAALNRGDVEAIVSL